MALPSRRHTTPDSASGTTALAAAGDNAARAIRINSRDLFQQVREVEIDHDGRIYRLRLTQLNKLILTA